MKKNQSGAASALLIVAAGLLVAAHMGAGYADRKIEREIEKRLPTMMGPAASYKVKVSAGPMSLMGKKLNTVDIYGKQVFAAGKVTIDDIHVQLKGVGFDAGKQKVTSIESNAIVASISQANLATYVAANYADIPGTQITLNEGYFSVSAKPVFIGFNPMVTADGTLSVWEGTKIALNLTRFSAIGVPVPGFVRDKLQQRFNPILDMAEFGYGIIVASVEVHKGFITVNGQVDGTKFITP